MDEQSIFVTALEKKDPAERDAFLSEACRGNSKLKAQVEELLALEDGSSFLEHPPAGLDATIDSSLSGKDTVDSGVTMSSLPFLQPCEKAGRIGKLGDYEIIEVIGQGGMGSVLRAVDTKLSRIVAVKVMAPELAANPTAVKRFLREAQSAAAVVHDHVVHIYGVYDESRPPYLVMEFVAGQTLQQKIDREGSLQLRHILRIGSQMAAGLAAAHKTGLIHRDVKPGNILLENGVERVKITDFGLARAADDVEMTKTGMIAGTPQYMSPEQARGELIDTRSDLFSLGCVLYAMCTGRPPFRAETTMGTLRRVCEDIPRPIREVNPEIPEWLTATIDKLLAKRPDDRFQTATEVADLLSQFLAHLQQPATMPLPATPIVPVPAIAVSKWEQRSSPSFGLGIVAIVCVALLAVPTLGMLILGLGWFLYASGGSKTMTTTVSRPNSAGDSITTAEMPSKLVDEGWTSLFNGSDLDGWETHPEEPGSWRVKDGAIEASGIPGYLFTKRDDFRDFHLRFEVSINSGGDGGVLFRSPFVRSTKDGLPGYEAQIQSGQPASFGWSTGAIGRVRPEKGWQLLQRTQTELAPAVWWPMEVIVRGNHIETKIGDGVRMAEFTDPDHAFNSGRIVLQQSTPNTRIKFRNIEVRELPGIAGLALAPFDANQAKVHQENCAKELGIKPDYTNSLGMKMRLIPPGEFLMGQTQEETDRLVQSLEQAGAGDYDKFVARMSSPQHNVRITQPFYFGIHEVTVGQYRKFIEKTKYVSSIEQLGVKDRFSWTASIAEPNADQRAVIGVSWDDAKAFCKWLSKEEGMAYDLPTEAQWEYACRAGTTTAWSFGEDSSGLADHAIHGHKSFWPAEVVGSKSANPFGLFDMHGNADEWCLDWHLRDFYAKSPVDDPICLTDPKEKTSGRVTRGGAALSAPWWTRSTTRAYEFQSVPNTPKGFRVVLSHPESTSWTRLFNGKDLAGWKVHPSQENKWKVEDGILVGTGGNSNLFTERGDFENFELRVEAKVSDRGNSGVMLRSEYGFNFDLTRAGGAGQLPRGMEVDIHPGTQPEPAGSIWHLGEPQWMEKASVQLVKSDQWFTLHVIARGKQLEVSIDGKPVVKDVTNQVTFDRGHILLLQQLKGAGQVWFRKIDIKELPATPLSKQIANWGEFVDPLGDCRAETKDGKLTITAPGSRVHDLNPRVGFNNKLDAPRVVRSLEGDFLMQVRVEPTPPLKTGNAGHSGGSYQGAGLVVWCSDKKLIRLERASMGESNQGMPYVHAEWFDDAQVVEADRQNAPGGPTYLQIERRGQQLHLRWSSDGKKWTDTKRADLRLPDVLQVGPLCVNCVTQDFAPIYSEFKVVTDPDFTLSRFDPARVETLRKDAVLRFDFEKESFFDKDGKTFVRDLSGRENHGLCQDVQSDTVGKSGGGLRNDGPGYVRLPKPLIANQPAYTVAGWMKLKVPRITKPAILYNCASAKDPRHKPAFHVWLDQGGHIFCAVWHETKEWKDLTTSSNQLDRDRQDWIFMAARYDDADNGGTMRVTLGDQTITRPFHMLKNSESANSTDYLGLDLAGWLDEVSLWHRSLTDDDLHFVQMLGRAGRSLSNLDAASPEPARANSPQNATQAAATQVAWAKHLGKDLEITNSLGMKLQLIPPGELMMGSSTEEVEKLLKEDEELRTNEWMVDITRGEGPQRRVTIHKPFYCGAHEVTVGQFREFVKAKNYKTTAELSGGGLTWDIPQKKWAQKPENVWNNPKLSGSEAHPVGFLTMTDALAFCSWLSEQEGRKYNVPTEEQWEYACRAGSDTRWYFGDAVTLMSKHGWVLPHSGGKYHPVGRLESNPFGLFDVYGNASELSLNPQHQAVERGGGPGLSPLRSRSATRWVIDKPQETVEGRGFRIAMAIAD